MVVAARILAGGGLVGTHALLVLQLPQAAPVLPRSHHSQRLSPPPEKKGWGQTTAAPFCPSLPLAGWAAGTPGDLLLTPGPAWGPRRQRERPGSGGVMGGVTGGRRHPSVWKGEAVQARAGGMGRDSRGLGRAGGMRYWAGGEPLVL